MFDETDGVLLSSDLFHQNGGVEAVMQSDVVGRFKAMLIEYQQGPFAYYLPLASHTEATLDHLAALKPNVLAAMHGSTFIGDGARAISDLKQVVKDVLG